MSEQDANSRVPPPSSPKYQVQYSATNWGAIAKNAALIIGLVITVGIAGYFIATRILQPQKTTTIAPQLRLPVVTIEEITPLAELATVRYQSVIDITNERVPENILKYLGFKEEILILVYGNVKAGFDLSQLNEDSLWIDGTRVQLVLPAPTIISASIDFNRTRVVTTKKSFLLPHEPGFETETLGIAREKIIQSAIDSGILETAREYGQNFFENYFRTLGFEEIRIIIQ